MTAKVNFKLVIFVIFLLILLICQWQFESICENVKAADTGHHQKGFRHIFIDSSCWPFKSFEATTQIKTFEEPFLNLETLMINSYLLANQKTNFILCQIAPEEYGFCSILLTLIYFS